MLDSALGTGASVEEVTKDACSQRDDICPVQGLHPLQVQTEVRSLQGKNKHRKFKKQRAGLQGRSTGGVDGGRAVVEGTRPSPAGPSS